MSKSGRNPKPPNLSKGESDEVDEAKLRKAARGELSNFGKNEVPRDIQYLHIQGCSVDFMNQKQGDTNAGVGNDQQKSTPDTYKTDVRHLYAFDSVRDKIDWEKVKQQRDSAKTAAFVNPEWKGIKTMSEFGNL